MVILNQLSPSSVPKVQLPSPRRSLDIDLFGRRAVLTKRLRISNNTTRTSGDDLVSAWVSRDRRPFPGMPVVWARPSDVARVGPTRGWHVGLFIGGGCPGRKGQTVSDGAGHLPDEGCAGAGHLRRQGQKPAQPRQLVLSQDRQRRPSDLRLDRRGRRYRVSGRRQRGRRTLDGSPPGQGHSAQVQPRPQG